MYSFLRKLVYNYSKIKLINPFVPRRIQQVDFIETCYSGVFGIADYMNLEKVEILSGNQENKFNFRANPVLSILRQFWAILRCR